MKLKLSQAYPTVEIERGNPAQHYQGQAMLRILLCFVCLTSRSCRRHHLTVMSCSPEPAVPHFYSGCVIANASAWHLTRWKWVPLQVKITHNTNMINKMNHIEEENILKLKFNELYSGSLLDPSSRPRYWKQTLINK